MEEIIVTGVVVVGLLTAIVTSPKLADKQEERKARKAEKARLDAEQAKVQEFYDFLEVAAEVRKANPANFVAGSVELPSYGR